MGNNRTYKLFIVCGFFISSSVYPFVSQAARNFIKKYSIEASVQEKADVLFSRPEVQKAFLNRDRNKLTLLGFKLYPTWEKGGSIVVEHPSLEGWIAKGEKKSIYGGRNITRLVFGDAIRRAIQKWHLDEFKVVEEHLYHLPGKRKSINGNNYLILSKKVTTIPEGFSVFSQDFLEKIKWFVKKIGYWDAHRDNILPVQDGDKIKAVFIDTEPFPTFDTWMWSVVRLIAGKIGVDRFKKVMPKKIHKS